MLLISKNYVYSQKTPEDFGYKSMSFKFQDDRVDLIVIAKLGEEKMAKPIFFFCQESLPKPIIIYDEKGMYPLAPFNENSFLDDYHIVIVAKPYVPLLADANDLGADFMFLKDKNNIVPSKAYSDRNYLDYYVFRNNFILKQLRKERWVDNAKLVVVGHADGSAIATKMTLLYSKITHLIYSNGNPFGHIATVLYQEQNALQTLDYWQEVVGKAAIINYDSVNTFKAIYSFSLPQRDNLLRLSIPILVTSETRKSSANNIDLFQLEVIAERKQNFSFLRYTTAEDNFCHYDDAKRTHYKIDDWDIATAVWLKTNS